MGIAREQDGEKIRLKLLLVEDNPLDADLILRELRRDDFVISDDIVRTPDQYRRQLRESPPDIVLSDYNLLTWGGMDALEILKEIAPEIPFILVSGSLGEITAVECIKRGVTDYVLKDSLGRLPSSIRRALRERVLKAQKESAETDLARSNHDLEQFASAASHDLQEPLRMVATYTQLLSERYSGKLDAQADKYIHYAVDGSVRMQGLIQDLLVFSRVGREGREIKATACNPVLKAALMNLTAAVQESGAVIEHDELPVVMANAAQLQQVFQNLIGNAIKFAGAKAPVMKISAERKNNQWTFAVSDNGIGIAAEQAETVFRIFQRLHTRTEYPGNGIGLAICKKIIECQGGRIWIESPSQGGTTFKFTLPAAEPEVAKSGQTEVPGKSVAATA